MFIAMNRFKVAPGAEADTHLRGVPGFVAFHLLRGAGRDDHVLYSSHAVWNSRGDFEAWREMDFRFSRA